MSQTINFFGVAAKALEKKFCFIEHPGQRGVRPEVFRRRRSDRQARDAAASLRDMRHRTEHWRIAFQTLVAQNYLVFSLGNVKCFAIRKTKQVVALLFNRPRCFDGGVNSFGESRSADQHFANSLNFDNVYADGNNHK